MLQRASGKQLRSSVINRTADIERTIQKWRVTFVVRYPYKIFYRVRHDIVEILHIRHTSRRAWTGDR
jgi:plasmid stabilization system protein ParE